MIQLLKDEWLRLAGIGQRCVIIMKNEERYEGIVRDISDSHIGILEKKAGIPIELLTDEIDRAIIGKENGNRIAPKTELPKFQRRCDANAESAHFVLSRVYRSALEAYIAECGSDALKQYLLTEINNRAERFLPTEIEEYYSQFSKQKPSDRSTEEIIRAMLYLKMHQESKAVATILSTVEHSDIAEVSLKMACLFSQMKSGVATLYWLEKYYAEADIHSALLDKTWWQFLRLCVRFTAFERIGEILRKVAEQSPVLAVQSLAYLLLKNQNTGIALNVWDIADDLLTEREAVFCIEQNADFLVPDEDNNYHRYLRCIQEIFNDGKIAEYQDSDDIFGYVYDYIPDRDFGFIVGNDLMSYFFRTESVKSDDVMVRVRMNICSFVPVNDEELVNVIFKRSLESKRSYNAVQIV